MRVVFGRFNDGRFTEELQKNAAKLGGDILPLNLLDLPIAKAKDALKGLDESALNALLDAEYAGKARQGMVDEIESALAEL